MGIRSPPSVLSVMASTPFFASESGITLIMSKESSDVTAVYPRGTVIKMATATMAFAWFTENFPAHVKYLRPASVSLP